MLMAHFYKQWRREGMEPPEALREAQKWVRDTTNQQKKEYFKGFLPDATVSRMPTEVADALFQEVVLSDPQACDFAHPYHWAAFVYVGV
jgi:CHAT domain-containing protein